MFLLHCIMNNFFTKPKKKIENFLDSLQLLSRLNLLLLSKSCSVTIHSGVKNEKKCNLGSCTAHYGLPTLTTPSKLKKESNQLDIFPVSVAVQMLALEAYLCPFLCLFVVEIFTTWRRPICL